MLRRLALVGLTCVVCSGFDRASARSAPDGIATEGVQDLSPRAGRRHGRPAHLPGHAVALSVLPPARPAEAVAADGPARPTPAAAAEPGQAATAPLFTTFGQAQILDASRLSEAAPSPDAAPFAPVSTGARLLPEPSPGEEASLLPVPTRIVSVIPPLRPSFAGSVAGATPDPSGLDGAATAADVVRVLPPIRPAFRHDPSGEAEPTVAEAEPDPIASPTQTTPSGLAALFGSFSTPAAPAPAVGGGGHGGIDALITRHASLNGVPEALVHRVVIRESRYNPRAVGRGGALGLMQIKHGTARALGYEGSASGLLDADTNLTYAVKYLAGAYRTARGNFDRAVSYYANGYYYAAKREGLVQTAKRGERMSALRQDADASSVSQ